jgi:hypothetical protein
MCEEQGRAAPSDGSDLKTRAAAQVERLPHLRLNNRARRFFKKVEEAGVGDTARASDDESVPYAKSIYDPRDPGQVFIACSSEYHPVDLVRYRRKPAPDSLG